MPHARTWDAAYEAIPSDSLPETLGQGASRIRQLKQDIRERAEVDHDWDDTTHAGKHKQVTLQKASGNPTISGDDTSLFTKDVSATPELHFKDKVGNVIQLTNAGNVEVGDFSANEAAMQAVLAPGETGTVTLPVSLFEELKQIRYALKRMGIGVSTGKNWYDTPARFGASSMIRDGRFPFHPYGTPAPPDGWAHSGGAPTTVEHVTMQTSEEKGKSIRVVAGTANYGLEQTVTGLKAGTKYLVSTRVRPVVGICKLVTTGAASGAFTNLSINSVSGGGVYQTLAGIVKTAAALPTDIVVAVQGVATTSDFEIVSVSMVECVEDAPQIVQALSVQTRGFTAGQTTNSTTLAALNMDGPLAGVVPGPDYILRIEGYIVGSGTSSNAGVEIELRLSINGGATTVVQKTGSNGVNSSDDAVGISILQYSLLDRTPGDSYVFTLEWQKTNGSSIWTLDETKSSISFTFLRP